MASIMVEQVWKRFELRRDRSDSVGHLLVRMIPGRPKPKPETFWALRDVSLEMPPGVSFGIVGNNGSGKSTFLKLITRTMRPTSGNIRVNGRVSALIELGAGFHPDFTGRENIVLNASILGIGRRAIERKMDEIIDFAEIRPFIDSPVKYYSSGMHARLGFAVATSVEPEILIVDEVLAVGDEAFQQKCMDRIFHMKRAGTSILLVSHDLSSIERLMDRAVWLDKGVMRAQGVPRDVVFAYRQSMLAPATGEKEGVTETLHDQDFLTLASAEVQSGGKETAAVFSGERMTVVTHWQLDAMEPFHGHLNLTIRRPDGLDVLSVSSLRDGLPLTWQPGVQLLSVDIEGLRLTTGQYEVDGEVMDLNGRRLLEWRPLLTFQVQAMERAPGLLVLPHHWRVG